MFIFTFAHLFGEFEVAGEIFANDIELDVDFGADLDEPEVRVLVGVRDNAHGYVPCIALDVGFADREADAVDGHRAFVHAEVPPTDHLRRRVVRKAEIPRAVCLAALDASGFLIDVPLYDVSVQGFVERHSSFEIDVVTDLERIEVGETKRFLHSGDGVGVTIRRNNRQTHAVVGDGLIDTERTLKRIAQGEMLIGLLLVNFDDLSHCFYDS